MVEALLYAAVIIVIFMRSGVYFYNDGQRLFIVNGKKKTARKFSPAFLFRKYVANPKKMITFARKFF